MQITTAAEAASRDADAIASGIHSWTLMHAAGTAAGEFVATVAHAVDAKVVLVWAGTGNNGGDAYVVATHLLTHSTIPVVLNETGPPRTDDATRAREAYVKARETAPPAPRMMTDTDQTQFVLVDGLLGTGQHGALRAPERALTAHVSSFGAKGGIVVALDVPTGVNATTGEIVEDAVRADYTLSFGTMKRAHVLQREQCGEIIVFDIGLGAFANKDDGAWTLVDAAMLRTRVPSISWEAHKGTRGRIAIVGGAPGMAGAVVLASDAALHSGAGLVFAYVAAESVLPVQINVPQAMAHPVSKDTLREQLSGVHAVVVGPGFGRGAQSKALLDALLETLINESPTVPLVLDADALTLIGTDAVRLKSLARARQVVCTPHVGEFARLLGKPAAATLVDRIAQAQELAARTGCTILLKGTPTVVVSPKADGAMVVARGTPVLATGGSGDLLSGMIGTLLAQGARGADAAAIAAWVHGRAAELATDRAGAVRGVTLGEVLTAMPNAWREIAARPAPAPLPSPSPSPLPSPSPSRERLVATAHAASTNHSVILAQLPRVWSDPNT